MVIQHLRPTLKDPNNPRPGSSVWKKVCFDDVHIREYAFILGDNPAVSKGAPLTIDWTPHREDVVDIDVFEHCRASVRRHRRKIVLSPRKRAKILLSCGTSVEDIADMTLMCQTIKKQRVESIKNQGNWDFGSLGNIGEFLSGTAEVTGRTLQLVEFFPNAINATAQGVGKMVLGTGTVAKDVALGTGRMGKDIILGTGKVGYDVVVGSGKVATDVVLGTGRVVTTGVTEVAKGSAALVVGTGKLTGDLIIGTGKGIGKVGKRMSSIFSLGDVVKKSDLKERKAHLQHVDRRALSPGPGTSTSRQRRYADAGFSSSSARHIMKTSPKNSPKLSPTQEGGSKPSLGLENDLRELEEMEKFMNQLQGMDPDQVKKALRQQRDQLKV